jgi:hypothetical protein
MPLKTKNHGHVSQQERVQDRSQEWRTDTTVEPGHRIMFHGSFEPVSHYQVSAVAERHDVLDYICFGIGKGFTTIFPYTSQSP